MIYPVVTLVLALAPVLGRAWAPDQQGYGRAEPVTVYNGGDPTGLVRHIRWTSWGGTEAVGTGTSTYVWPGTGVADNPPVRGARIVAFHLGTCRGRASYNAVEWFFPRYGEAFDPRRYIDTCTGAYVGAELPKFAKCSALTLGRLTVEDVQVAHVSCAAARRLIRAAPLRRYVVSGGRFVQAGFRCGTTGSTNGPALFDCRRERSEFLYEAVRRP